MASSTALPNQQAVQAYCRQEKRARIAGAADLPHARCGSPAADPNWRDWADLTAGPAGLIAERVLADNIVDYLRFRAVCKSWRRCTASQHAHGGLDRRFHPRRWIMLPRTSGALRKRRDFLNVSTGKRIQVDLSELRCQYVFGATSEGLLVLCHKCTYAVRLLNPLTRQLVVLPNATTLLYNPNTQWSRNRCSLKYLRVSGSGLASGSTVALHLGPCSLFVAKPGDERWTPLPVDHRNNNAIIATCSFDSRFYCVTEKAVMAVDTTAGQPPQLVVVAELSNWGFKRHDQTVNLVDNDGELVLVHRARRDNNNAFRGFRGGYEVHQVDPEAGITLPMQGLGGHALFVGMRQLGQRGLALLVHAGPFPCVGADTVYSFMDYGSKYDPPRIEAYRLPYGYGRIQGRIDGAGPCSVIEDYVSRYVCGRKIVMVKGRRRRRRQALRLRRRRRP